VPKPAICTREAKTISWERTGQRDRQIHLLGRLLLIGGFRLKLRCVRAEARPIIYREVVPLLIFRTAFSILVAAARQLRATLGWPATCSAVCRQIATSVNNTAASPCPSTRRVSVQRSRSGCEPAMSRPSLMNGFALLGGAIFPLLLPSHSHSKTNSLVQGPSHRQRELDPRAGFLQKHRVRRQPPSVRQIKVAGRNDDRQFRIAGAGHFHEF
jgi:hypothetical protein